MFCAIATTIERCKTEGVVDVFQVVKALRVQKPGAVLNVVSTTIESVIVCANIVCIVLLQEQYQDVFSAVLCFLDSFDTYANFQNV